MFDASYGRGLVFSPFLFFPPPFSSFIFSSLFFRFVSSSLFSLHFAAANESGMGPMHDA